MNIREKIISDNFNRCGDPKNKLTPSEQATINRLKFRGIQSQKDFNQLASIATSSEYRGREVRSYAYIKCPSCKKEVLWIKTLNDKNILINANSFNGEPHYIPSIHSCHWNECEAYIPPPTLTRVKSSAI